MFWGSRLRTRRRQTAEEATTATHSDARSSSINLLRFVCEKKQIFFFGSEPLLMMIKKHFPRPFCRGKFFKSILWARNMNQQKGLFFIFGNQQQVAHPTLIIRLELLLIKITFFSANCTWLDFTIYRLLVTQIKERKNSLIKSTRCDIFRDLWTASKIKIYWLADVAFF